MSRARCRQATDGVARGSATHSFCLMDEQRAQFRDLTDLPLSLAVVGLIDRANDEAARHSHEYIGTEHLVLALSQPDAPQNPLLALRVERQRLYALIDEIIRRGSAPTSADIERPFTSRTKQTFSFAAAVARELGHARIEVPHLLVGLMRERKGIGAQVLADQGLTEERALEFARD